MLPFLSAMLGLILFGLFAGERWLVGTALVLIAKWAAEVGMVQLSGEQFPWMFFIVADYLSALLLAASFMTFDRNRWQIVVASIYAGQIVIHASFALSKQDAWARYDYWYALTYSGWLQLAVVLGGGVYGVYRRYRRRSVGVSYPVDLHGSAKDARW